MSKVADALHYAHQEGIIHRDIKPENIIVDIGGAPFVADFGLAQIADKRITEADVSLGTVAYIAPEQCRDSNVTAQADIFSLGVIIFEALCLSLPFQAASRHEYLAQLAICDIPPVNQLNRSVPSDLAAICDRCLMRQPESRYANAHDLSQDLIRFCRGEPTIARPIGSFGYWLRRVARFRKRVLILFFAIVFFVFLGWFLRHQQSIGDSIAVRIAISSPDQIDAEISRAKQFYMRVAIANSIRQKLETTETTDQKMNLLYSLHQIDSLNNQDISWLIQNLHQLGTHVQHCLIVLGDEKHREMVLSLLTSNRPEKKQDCIHSIVLMYLGNKNQALQLTRIDEDQTDREHFIDTMASLNLTPRQFLSFLDSSEPDLKSALLLALGDSDHEADGIRGTLISAIERVYSKCKLDVVRSSALYCLNRLETPEDRSKVEKLDFCYVPAGRLRYEVGEESFELTNDQPFLVSSTEISGRLFHETLESTNSETYSTRLPAQKISLLNALQFCNSLSLQEGFTEYYRDLEQVEGDLSKLKFDGHSMGFRLPTRQQWYWLARAKSTTKYFYGQQTIGLARHKYGWFFDDIDEKTNGVGFSAFKRPNGFGIFDVYGNTKELVQVSNSEFRSIGGSYFHAASDCNSLDEGSKILYPTKKLSTYGLRVIRPLDR